MKNWKTKFTIFFLSLIVSVVTVEFGLRYLIKQTNLPRIYHDVAEYNLSDRESAGKSDYYRDRSMEIYGGKEPLEILCIGDSFTNGGNTFWDNSYPYKLYLKFNKKVTVRNLGVCASTTEQIATRLEDFYKSNQYSSEKKYVIAVMAGSADVFAGSELVQKISALNISKEQKWVEMNQKTDSFFSQFYFYKVVTLLAQDLKNRIDKVDSVTEQVTFSNQELSACHSAKTSKERVDCLIKTLKMESYNKLSQGSKEYLIIRFLLEKKAFKSSEVTEVIRDFMGLVEYQPQLLERDYLVMNLLGLVKLQDIVSFEELKAVIEKNSHRIALEAQKVNQELISNASYWYDNLEKLNGERDIYWKKIFTLAREHNSSIVVMNYPLPYQSTNGYLQTLAKKEGSEFIDVEKIFTLHQKGADVLLDDWEHCSPEGYDLIAQTLYDKIELMSQERKGK
ncbi:hypothetical protein C0V70_17770 [Bacteriovorax stolpii]|uniref:Uncharacterized protein n=1 Tax=Bacteriovorax stolpii TaxID=960 RepID=A0A2K9NWP9_BACTC|nr:SGNH/GDSL hydrolase family protein [Bacteriovorax stolpii]AUN99920.1 hypothetical protein C0V70_17770 [Bacteriovorax stolpii]TDP54187.1 hypothetical protein C8D79_1480 [Bacteriovorax stolpii]